MTQLQSLNTCPVGHGYHAKHWGDCPICQGLGNARTGERVADEIRRLKTAMEAGHEKNAYVAVGNLHELGHPDVQGLVNTIRLRLEGERTKGGAKRRAIRAEH